MPKVPRQRSYKQPKPGKEVATTGRRSARRMVAATGMFVAVAVILTGCSPDLWPDFLGGSKGADRFSAPTSFRLERPATATVAAASGPRSGAPPGGAGLCPKPRARASRAAPQGEDSCRLQCRGRAGTPRAAR